jgi:hypothetical protein
VQAIKLSVRRIACRQGRLMSGDCLLGPTARQHDVGQFASIVSCSEARDAPPRQNETPPPQATKQRGAVFGSSTRPRTPPSRADYIPKGDPSEAYRVAQRAPYDRVAERQRLERGAEHLHALGSRSIAEFLDELADMPQTHDRMLPMLDVWRSRRTVEMIRAVGADWFPPHHSPVPAAAVSVDGG